MTNATILKKLESIERDIQKIRLHVGAPRRSVWREVAGTFANDPLFEKAMRYGAEYRDSLRPKETRRGGKKR